MNVLIFGGSGFLGESIVMSLEKKGIFYKLFTTRQKKSNNSNDYIYGDLKDIESLKEIIKKNSFDSVIYSIGLIKESKGRSFKDAHIYFLENILEAMRETQIKRIILVSANGIDKEVTEYQKTKLKGEDLVKQSKLDWTIVRPSIIWGDSRKFNFKKMLLNISKIRIVPVIIGVNPIFEPINRSDLSDAIVDILGKKTTYGKTLTACGIEKFSFTKLIKKLRKTSILVGIPLPIVLTLTKILGSLPFFPINLEQIQMLQFDNVDEKKYDKIWKYSDIKPKKLIF